MPGEPSPYQLTADQAERTAAVLRRELQELRVTKLQRVLFFLLQAAAMTTVVAYLLVIAGIISRSDLLSEVAWWIAMLGLFAAALLAPMNLPLFRRTLAQRRWIRMQGVDRRTVRDERAGWVRWLTGLLRWSGMVFGMVLGATGLFLLAAIGLQELLYTGPVAEGAGSFAVLSAILVLAGIGLVLVPLIAGTRQRLKRFAEVVELQRTLETRRGRQDETGAGAVRISTPEATRIARIERERIDRLRAEAVAEGLKAGAGETGFVLLKSRRSIEALSALGGAAREAVERRIEGLTLDPPAAKGTGGARRLPVPGSGVRLVVEVDEAAGRLKLLDLEPESGPPSSGVAGGADA